MKLNIKAYNPNLKKKKLSRKRLSVLLFALGGLLLVAAAGVFLFQWFEGKQAEKNAQVLLGELSASTATEKTDMLLPPADGTDDYDQPDAPDVGEDDLPAVLEALEGYSVIAQMDIDTLGIQLPVLSKTSPEALKISICYFSGPNPGEDGNLVITGHNYRSGAHFGTLDKIEVGTEVKLTDPDGEVFVYTVYKIEHIKPDEAEKLSSTKHDCELTLVTCEARGNSRLIVRCKKN